MQPLGIGAMVVVLHLCTHSSSKVIPPKHGAYVTSSLTTDKKNLPDFELEVAEPRLYLDSIKSGLVRLIKSYRSVKPEFSVGMCFLRYSGVVSSDARRTKRDSKVKEKVKEEEVVTIKTMIRDVVHMFMLFLSDMLPPPVSYMMRMTSEVWSMSKVMYKSVKHDEMGNCSLDYMSKRFWWWLGI